MQTSVEVFLEQIIDNVAFFECNQEDKIAEDKNNYTVLKVIVSKEKINTLKIGYYYELRLSKSMTPYKIYEDNNDEWDFYFYPYDVQYINLEIKIEETFRKRKLVVETYRKTYLLSSFFSDIFFYKPDENIWMHKIACIKSTIKKIIDGNYNHEEISTESSNTNAGERDEKIFAKLINIINEDGIQLFHLNRYGNSITESLRIIIVVWSLKLSISGCLATKFFLSSSVALSLKNSSLAQYAN